MRTLDQISREEWLVYLWHEVTPIGSNSRIFAKGKARPWETMDQAARQYDEMIAGLTQRSTTETKEDQRHYEHSTHSLNKRVTSGDHRQRQR